MCYNGCEAMNTFKDLYNAIALRKGESRAPVGYKGGNGRIDRAATLIGSWELPEDAALLDIGGATGNLGYLVRDLFRERYVMEIAEDCRSTAEAQGNQFSCGNVDEMGLRQFPSECIDVITMLDLIEHVLDPVGLLRECHRVLRPNGRILINTPNIQHWRHLHELVVNGSFPHTSGDRDVYHGGHVGFYNLRDMSVMLSDCPFTDLRMEIDGLSADPPPPIWVTLARYPDAVKQMSYADLVVSARKA